MPDAGDPYYSPWRVRWLLARYPSLMELRPRRADDELRLPHSPRNHPALWWEGQACKRADIALAFGVLPWFTQKALIHSVVYELPDVKVAPIMGCDRETVRRHRIDGLRAMSETLGYPPDLAATWSSVQSRPRVARAQIYRKVIAEEVTG